MLRFPYGGHLRSLCSFPGRSRPSLLDSAMKYPQGENILLESCQQSPATRLGKPRLLTWTITKISRLELDAKHGSSPEVLIYLIVSMDKREIITGACGLVWIVSTYPLCPAGLGGHLQFSGIV